jgi:hypothetical protein
MERGPANAQHSGPGDKAASRSAGRDDPVEGFTRVVEAGLTGANWGFTAGSVNCSAGIPAGDLLDEHLDVTEGSPAGMILLANSMPLG